MRRPLLPAGLLILALLLSACTGTPDPAVTGGSASPAASAAPVPTESAATPDPTPGENPAAPSATPAAIPEVSPSPTPDWTQGEEGELVVRSDGEEVHIPAYGREYVLREEPHLGFCMMTPKETVLPRYDANAWYFPIQGDSEALLELSFISGGDAQDLLPDFMGAYLQFNEIEFSGSSKLGRLAMDETITASGTALTDAGDDPGAALLVKAWLLNVPDGVFSVVLYCAVDRMDGELGTLEAMLETLTLTM